MKRRFRAQETTVKSNLRTTMKKVEATSLKIESDEMNGEIKVIFDRDGKRYTKTCNRWEDPLDNLRAIQLSIEYLYRALEVYGVESEEEFSELFNTIFIGLEATPDDDVLMLGNGTKEWWEFLGIKQDATKKDIINAYKALAKTHHPDAGGDSETFKRLRKAYDEGISSLMKN